MMTIDTNNRRSRSASEKCGFRLEGVMRKHMLLRGNRSRDTAVYALLDDEWPELRQRVFAT